MHRKTTLTLGPVRLCASMLLAIGCLPMHTYEIPDSAEDGRFVKLTHRASVMDYIDLSDDELRQAASVHVRAPDDESCPRPHPYEDAGMVPGVFERRGLQYEPGADSLEIDVPVDLLVFVETLVILRGFAQTDSCSMEIGFYPREGHEYEYRFRLGSDSCMAEVFDEAGEAVPTTNLHACYQFRRWSEEEEAREAESSI